MSSARSFEAPATQWGIVALAVAAGIIAALQVGKVPPSLPVLRADLGVGLVAAGWVQSLFNACGAGLGVAAGAAADRIGARRVMVGCLLLLALGCLIGGLAPAIPLLLFGRLVEGVGFVGLVVAAPAIIASATEPGRRQLALGIWGIYMPTGMTVALVAAPAILTRVGWQGLWLANAALLGLFALAVAYVLANREAGDGSVREPRRGWRELRQTLRRPGPWLYGFCFTLYALQFFAVMAWLPTFLVETQGQTLGTAAFWTAVVVAVNVPGNLAAAWLLHRGIANWRLIATAYVAMAVTALGIFSDFAPDGVRVPLAIAFSAFGGLLPAAALAGAPAHAATRAEIATVSGIVVQGSNIGGLMGPPVMAAVAALSGGWQQSHWLLMTCGGAGLLLTFALRAIERRQK